MSSTRALIIAFILGFVGVGLLKAVGTHPATASRPGDVAQQEQVRLFWDTYRRASRERSAGKLDTAAESYRQALALKPDHEDSLYYLGHCYLETGRYPEARRAYEQLIAANRLGSSRGYVQLALLHADLRPGAPFDLARSQQFFQQALQVDPDSGALLGIGEVALLQGSDQRAREALQGVNADNATSVAAPYLLGYLCWREHRQEEAWRWFRQAVKHCKVKKPPVKWSEEGDLKADPELRWRALAQQSVLGDHWIRLRRYLKTPNLALTVMDTEYRALQATLGTVRQRLSRA